MVLWGDRQCCGLVHAHGPQTEMNFASITINLNLKNCLITLQYVLLFKFLIRCHKLILLMFSILDRKNNDVYKE